MPAQSTIFFRCFLFLALITGLYACSATQKTSAPSDAARYGQYDVEIIRDNWGIPHIYGVSDADVAYGLGYAQSEDDFETLQRVILATRGQLASVLGKEHARSDYLVQWMGIWTAVDRGYPKLSKSARAVAEAYADGVNRYAEQNPAAVYDPLLPVTGKDIVAGFTLKTPMFYGFDKTLQALLADQPQQGESLALGGMSTQFGGLGSQGIALAPQRSEEGVTRLLLNSHQPLTGPVAWYEARLHSEEGWNITGSTFPGAPVILQGHTPDLGWANTVNRPDLVDIYRLEIDPGNAMRYRLDGQWREFERDNASITVRLFGFLPWTVERPILRSVHGPVFETAHGVYALRWAGMGETATLEFLLRLNKARNQQEFEAALAMTAMPSINYVYADRNGNIAHYYNAMFPQRQDGPDWQNILPGDQSALVWDGYRDFDAMPRTLNPRSGLVFNANNTPHLATDGDDSLAGMEIPESMGIETANTSRALQLRDLFKTEASISRAEFMAVKYNTDYHPEARHVKALQQWLEPDQDSRFSEQERDARRLLRSWDLRTDKDNRAAALALLSMEPLRQNRDPDQASSVIEAAFRDAVEQLTRHHRRVDIPYGEISRMRRGDKDFPIAGGPDTLRAVYGAPLDGDGKLVNHKGDSFIMLVEWDRNGRVYSEAVHQYGSATLDEKSRHFNDQLDLFMARQLRPVWFDRAQLEQHISRRYRP